VIDHPTWTDDRIEVLKAHAASGLTSRQIGEEMNLSRNAVIGKLLRLGVSLSGSKVKPAPPVVPQRPQRPERRAPLDYQRVTRVVEEHVQIRPGKNTERRAEVQVIEATEIVDLPPGESRFACTIERLGYGMCRWPLGQPAADMKYCGAPALGSWCEHHHSVVFPRSRRA